MRNPSDGNMTVQLHDLSLDMILRYNEKHVRALHNGAISQAFASKTHFSLFQLSPTLTLHINMLQKIYSKSRLHYPDMLYNCMSFQAHTQKKRLNLQCKIPVCFFSFLFQVLSRAHFADRPQSDLWYHTILGEREREIELKAKNNIRMCKKGIVRSGFGREVLSCKMTAHKGLRIMLYSS